MTRGSLPKLLLAGAAVSLAGCAHQEIVGYYAGWKPETAVAPRDVTVINYAFAYLGFDGTIALDDPVKESPLLDRLVALKDGNRDLRVIISVGGWTRSSRFSDMAANPATRATFVKSTVAFLRRHRLDGIDIDWEYPTELGVPCPPAEICQRPEDKRNFVLLASELRTALDAAGYIDGQRYIATIAAGAGESFLFDPDRSSAWLRSLAASLDWINLMSYDYHGSWERVAGFNAPLRRDPNDPVDANVEASVKRLLDNGIPAGKIVLGVPFYGKGWSECARGPAGDGLYQRCTGLASGSADETFDFSYLTDNGYLARDGTGRYTVAGLGFMRYWNAPARVPYLYNATTGVFITYDDEASLREKLDLARQYRLRGVMFWEIGADRDGVLRSVVR
jgi:chitinase